MTKIYKVTHMVFGTHMSYTAKDSLAVEYKFGKIAKPLYGLLMAYKTPPDMNRVPIIYSCLECEYEEAETSPTELLDPVYIDGYNLPTVKGFWEGERKLGMLYMPVPAGTVFCKWLKPVRLITKWNQPEINF